MESVGDSILSALVQFQVKQLDITNLGLASFAHARVVQDSAVDSCYSKVELGSAGEKLIFCEHPPVLTLGRGADSARYIEEKLLWDSRGIELVEVSRGGKETYHGPGQLVIYPVMNLRQRQIGVRKFVELGLVAICRSIGEYGLDSYVNLCNPGVWIKPAKKIAAVGLKIERGITNHGFCVNVNCDLLPYSFFPACGMVDVKVTSLAAELGSEISLADFTRVVERNWCEVFQCCPIEI